MGSMTVHDASKPTTESGRKETQGRNGRDHQVQPMIFDGISECRGAKMMPKSFELGALWASRPAQDRLGRRCTLA